MNEKIKPLGMAVRTQRGFERIDFKDLYGERCSLQESSLADQSAVWLGCDHETVHEVTGEKIGARMHLNRAQVESLVTHLNQWLKTSSFKL